MIGLHERKPAYCDRAIQSQVGQGKPGPTGTALAAGPQPQGCRVHKLRLAPSAGQPRALPLSRTLDQQSAPRSAPAKAQSAGRAGAGRPTGCRAAADYALGKDRLIDNEGAKTRSTPTTFARQPSARRLGC